MNEDGRRNFEANRTARMRNLERGVILLKTSI